MRGAQETQNDDILSVQNEKYIFNLKDNFRNKTGKGLVNKALQYVPEMHLSLPSNILSEKVSNGSFNNTGKYSYCGPGTKIQKRINEGYKGVNSLDSACRKHGIYYSNDNKK